ncbi:hypothetical protein Y032_0011g1589 [Ancylostoma ceylanicum]|uniref:Uncharacterized protein n=1 Tax=Ancylostoma ceylanicum TaxID=53326 RepID=A0A016VHC9_9BILA|nr:hypothetical protein Y032_0011g1589 [Ancylostoma ceylanicum]
MELLRFRRQTLIQRVAGKLLISLITVFDSRKLFSYLEAVAETLRKQQVFHFLNASVQQLLRTAKIFPRT